MADVARLVGMEVREHEKDGQKKQFWLFPGDAGGSGFSDPGAAPGKGVRFDFRRGHCFGRGLFERLRPGPGGVGHE